MRKVTGLIALAFLGVQVAAGQSRIVYTLELGGNNHADLWEANQSVPFTHGVTSGCVLVPGGQDLTWGVRVSVGGVHNGDPSVPGGGLVPYGAANLVFDLELYDSSGNFVDLGAAPLVAQGNQNVPVSAGFWSSINDGDSAGTRGAISPDLLANAAFAIGIHNQDPAGPEPAQCYTLIDPAPYGPNFDYGWYPTANGRGGVDIDGTEPIDTSINLPELKGKLVGFGAGYRSYDYTNYRPGVGIAYLTAAGDYGFGAFVNRVSAPDPLAPPAGVSERVLFEGQICTKNLPAGTYALKVVPSYDGNNILHGAVDWDSPTPNYGGFGSFAAKADEVFPTPDNNPGMQFVVTTCCDVTRIAGRKLFYNQSWYDGYKPGIDGASLPGPVNDDADAIDPSKSPLMPGGGVATFANWTGYDKGINGLIYDVAFPQRDPVPADFAFHIIGRKGDIPVGPDSAVVPDQFRVQDLGGITRVILTFPNEAVANTWLQVDIGTGFGLPAPDVHYWGNVRYDCGTPSGIYIFVASTDEVGARNCPWLSASPRAPVTYRFDYNKDGFCNSTDAIGVRNHPAYSTSDCVRIITR